MNGKERLLTVLNGEIPDQVPVALFVQQEYLSYYYGRENTDRVKDAVALAKELDFDVFTRDTYHIEPFFTRRSFPNWEVEKKTFIDDNIVHRVVNIKTPEGTLTQEEVAPYDPMTIGGIHFSTSRYFINDLEKDFPIFKKYMPRPGLDYIQDMKEHAEWVTDQIGDKGLACPWGTGGVYNTASTFHALEDLLCDPYDDETLYTEYMHFVTDILVEDYRFLCDTPYQCLGMQGNIANGGMMGNAFFEEYVMPYEEQIISAVKDAGKHTLYHNCGYARGLYPAYQKMHMSIFETLSPSPQGDNVLSEAKKMLGDTKVLSGNLDQISFLKTASPKEVWEATRDIMLTGKPSGRYIFATSDFLEKNTPLENVKTVIEAAHEFGKY